MSIARAGYAELLVVAAYKEELVTGTKDSPTQFVLAPEARVAGRLVTRLPGIDIANVKVGLQGQPHGLFWREAITAEDGTFTMGGLPAGKANIFPYDHEPDGPWTYRAANDVELRHGEIMEAVRELVAGALVRAGAPALDSG